ncbi:MAG: DUF1611 domain-containing protein [Gammaproteobacteria bacterium]
MSSAAVAPTLDLPAPYLLFLGSETDDESAKTAFGLRDWARDACVGEIACPDATVTTGLPRLSPAQARTRGARSLVIGIANVGGRIEPQWLPILLDALAQGLDLVSGMHSRLGAVPELAQAAQRYGRRLVDVRVPPDGIPVASGLKRTGKRLLTVGTDCALGKKYTALAITRALTGRGLKADFRATGQTGILIAGRGVPMDAVKSDFVAGAAELLSPDAAADHWDVIEGQGSLLHPGYAAVSLGLLHGSQPDVLVVCTIPGRATMSGFPHRPLPGLEETIDVHLRMGRITNPAIRCAGISLNTAAFDEAGAKDLLGSQSARLGLPVADPVRGGAAFDALIDACLAAP